VDLSVVIHSYDPSVQEAKAGGPGVHSQPGLHNELQASLDYIVRSHFKHQKVNEGNSKEKYGLF
jgi:hypothetical protein